MPIIHQHGNSERAVGYTYASGAKGRKQEWKHGLRIHQNIEQLLTATKANL